MNANLFEEARQLENTITDMEHKLKPVTSMNTIVAQHKSNINAAYEHVNMIHENIRQAEQTAEILKRKRIILS